MIRKTESPQWIFSDDRYFKHIRFEGPEYMAFIMTNEKSDEVHSINIYDFEVKFLYAVNRRLDANHSLLGWMRPMSQDGDDFKIEWVGTFWMKERDKRRMSRLMRKLASFRSNPMPEEFECLWNKATEAVKNLDLYNPGQPVDA